MNLANSEHKSDCVSLGVLIAEGKPVNKHPKPLPKERVNGEKRMVATKHVGQSDLFVDPVHIVTPQQSGTY